MKNRVAFRTRAFFIPTHGRGGESHFSEPVNFMITGSIAVLRTASDSRLKWLSNIYQMGRDAIDAGAEGTQYYVIPANQPHADEAVNLVNVLLEGGIEIDRATESFRIGDQRYAEGDFIISAAQAFRPYVIDLLEKQTYPDTRLDPNGTIKAPYDIAGWTLPMQMGVTVDMIAENIEVDAESISGLVAPTPGEVQRQCQLRLRFRSLYQRGSQSSQQAVGCRRQDPRHE